MNKPAAQAQKPKTAINPTRADNFPEWYQEVIKAAEMAENSPVRGCMIIKPYGYAVWENMQRIFDDMIKELGVQNAYFPLLIPLSFIAKEAQHVEGFAKECAVVTHHRLESDGKGGLQPAPAAKLEEPLVIRPTSETIIGDAMARWIQSYRDLPLKLNQWCNIMRWEMRTRLFLRTSEFLWQEGHNAFETAEGAREDSLKMLEAYADFAENSLAIPVIKGEKTPDERFPGADVTYTIEAMMQDGKALQAGTSHDLGQNFSKSIGIKFQGRDGKEEFAYTTSWGISTRLIGAMIMAHGDDDGMIMPPRVAPRQVVIIPILRDDSDAGKILEYCRALKAKLKERNIRAHVDDTDARTPDKMWSAIKKGVPLRVEIGGREMETGQLTFIRRDIGKDSKKTVTVDEFVNAAGGVLDEIHKALFERAKAFRDGHIHDVKDMKQVEEFYKGNGEGFVRADAAILKDTAWEKTKGAHSLSARCLPLSDDGKKVIIGKAY
ncbi:MAG: proline--tRNA ligase [Alphaproteobacteria bacterium]|nr:proline--tRNA ligase [Alphaproteobacteria bacterium]